MHPLWTSRVDALHPAIHEHPSLDQSRATSYDMNIRTKEESLFHEWSQRIDGLVRDGAVDPEAYLESQPRVLFVLKEVNDKGGGGWDLREFIRRGARSATWNNVTRWMKGIRNLDRQLNWSVVDPVDESDRRKYLRSICVMNLKKTPGGGSSDTKVIRSAAERHRNLLTRQFHLYKPDLVICGGSGTGNAFREAVRDFENTDWERTTRNVKYCKNGQGQHVLDYFHPQARYKKEMLYYTLIDAIREVKQRRIP